MTNNQPTKERIKEFWLLCGLTFKNFPKDNETRWYFNGECLGTWSFGDLPALTLDNLFEYAIPKAIDKLMLPEEQGCSCEVAYAIIFKKWLQNLECDIPNHAATLFWAIWEIIK